LSSWICGGRASSTVEVTVSPNDCVTVTLSVLVEGEKEYVVEYKVLAASQRQDRLDAPSQRR
jgi:hypothetical protein